MRSRSVLRSMLAAGMIAYVLLRRTVTVPLDLLARAAQDVENERY